MAGIPRPRTPIDETLWRDTSWYRLYGPITNATVMQYFHMSAFFDPTSNNGVIMSQMEGNIALRNSITSQEAFDAQLRKMTGIEYIPVAGSSETGVWVIRKQNRRGPNNAQVLATYYISGENVYQAPSVGAVLGNRLLTITNDLRRCLEAANSIALQTQQPAQDPQKKDGSQPTSQQPPGSTPSAQSTPLPAAPTAAPTAVPQNLTKARKDARMMQHAFNLSLRHQNEYMDDHGPLLGDPGSLLSTAATSQHAHSNPQGTNVRGGTVTPQPGLRTGANTPLGAGGGDKKGLLGAAGRKVMGAGGGMKK